VGSNPTCATTFIMTIKRNHWHNEHVIKILKMLRDDPSLQDQDYYTYGLECAMSIFQRFDSDFTNREALAYLTDEDLVIQTGPKEAYERAS